MIIDLEPFRVGTVITYDGRPAEIVELEFRESNRRNYLTDRREHATTLEVTAELMPADTWAAGFAVPGWPAPNTLEIAGATWGVASMSLTARDFQIELIPLPQAETWSRK